MNVICLKVGTKYSARHVQRLYEMVRSNTTRNFYFYCVTDDSSGIENAAINIIKTPDKHDLHTFWWKLWMLSKEFPVKGKCVYLDLDMIIQNNIDELLDHDDNKLYLLDAVWKGVVDGTHMTRCNSSIMIWRAGKVDAFTEFMKDPDYNMTIYAGNDDFMEEHCIIEYLPTDWVYCKIWGYDRRNDQNLGQEYLTERYGHIPLYDIPEKKICLLNGSDYFPGILDVYC